MTRLRPTYVHTHPDRDKPKVGIFQTPASNPDGYVRRVGLTVLMPDPGRGGTNPPMRQANIVFNPADARAIARQLLADADEAEYQNRETGKGGLYTGDYANVMEDDMAYLRVPKMGCWGRLYLNETEFVEAKVVGILATEIHFECADGQTRAVPRTDSAMTAFATDVDNWTKP